MPAAAAESLVVTIDQTIDLPSASATSNRSNAIGKVNDSAMVDITTNTNSSTNSEGNKNAIPIHKAKTHRNTAAVDQAFATDDSQTEARTRKSSELRSRRGRKIKASIENLII